MYAVVFPDGWKPSRQELTIENDPSIVLEFTSGFFRILGKDLPEEFWESHYVSRRFHLLEWKDIVRRLTNV